MKTEKQARAQATREMKRWRLGKGWRIEAWENLGWHWVFRFGNHVVLRPSVWWKTGRVTSYSADLCEDYPCLKFYSNHIDPRMALNDTLVKVGKELGTLLVLQGYAVEARKKMVR